MRVKHYIVACKPFGFFHIERKTNKKSLRGLPIRQAAVEVIWQEFVMKARKTQLDDWFGSTDLELIRLEIEVNIMIVETADVNRLRTFISDTDNGLIIKENLHSQQKKIKQTITST